jgi:hypothetical protein
MKVNLNKPFKIAVLIACLYFILGTVYLKPRSFPLLVNPKLATPPSVFYYLKITREKLESVFIFGEEDTANWDLDLAGKRIDEAKVLSIYHQATLANIQLNKALSYQERANNLIKYLSDKTNVNYLRDKYNQNLEKIKTLN